MSEAPRLLPNGDVEIVHARLCSGNRHSHAHTFDPFAKYHPDQPRDERGRFADIAGTVAARTLINDGDTATYHGKQVRSGKAVSPYPERSKVVDRRGTDRPTRRAILTEEIGAFRSANADLLSQPNHSLGTWYDTSAGQLWLDVVVVVNTHEEAATLARQHNQIAYFDLDTGQEVQTGGTGLVKRIADFLGITSRSARVERGGDRRGDRGRDPRRDGVLDPFGLTKRFNANQPRHPKGHPDGGQWIDTTPEGPRLSPHLEVPYVSPTGRGGAPANPNATSLSGTPDDFKADILKRLASVGLTPADLVKNLDEVMQRVITEHPELLDIGLHWYQNAQDRISEHALEAGVPLDTAIAMTAVLSPNSEWGQNIALVGETMRQLQADEPLSMNAEDEAWLMEKAKSPKGQRFGALLDEMRANPRSTRLSELDPVLAAVGIQMTARRRSLVSENPTPKGTFSRVSYATGTSNIAKAVRIYRGENPDVVIGGHKVRSFHNNLADPYNARGFGDVTIDTHAASAAQQFRMPMTAKRADVTLWGGSSKGSNQMGSYPVYADAYREVADRYNMTPNQAQAVLWIGWQSVRHDYPGIVVSESQQVLDSGIKQADVYGPARASTIGRYSIQEGGGVLSPPRYSSHVSAYEQYKAGTIDWATYQDHLASIPD
jgi:hypothetical protein